MSEWSGDLRPRLAGLALGAAREGEIIEELSQHLDDRYEELRTAGASDVEARRRALEELSHDDALGERLRGLAQAHTPPPMTPGEPARGPLRGVWRDLRYAARMIRRQPGFAAIVIVTLAAGIAVNTLIFTIVNAAVLRPMPFDDPERLVRLSVQTADTQVPVGNVSYPDVRDWQRARRTLEQIAVVDDRTADLSGDQRPPIRIETSFISWNLLPLLRVPPILGRGFTADDDRQGAPLVALIGADLWRTRYAADTGVVGASIRVNGAPATIVGVMPPAFGFPNNSELFVPLSASPNQQLTARGDRGLTAIGRLRPGATMAQAQDELTGITTALAERYPDTNRNIAPRIVPAGISDRIVTIMFLLVGAVGFVLLIACANVANLLLARAADRGREVTLRLALGASRWRIVRQLLAESLLLAAAGGATGLVLSYAGLDLFFSNLGPEAAPPAWIQFTIDRVVLAYVGALCLGSAVICGLVPAWQVSRPNLVAALNDAGRADTGSRGRRRWTGTFVVAQVALALVLLTGASLMVSDLAGLLSLDAGVRTDDVLQATVSLRRDDYTPDRRRQFFSQLEERLAAGAGVESALASRAPMAGAEPRAVRLDGQPAPDARERPVVSLVDVGPRYFAVIGASVRTGQVFSDDDWRLPNDRVIVNEQFARTYFPGRQALGQRFLLETPDARSADTPQPATIVAVVSNVRQRMLPSREFDPVVYRAYAAETPPSMQIVARSAAGAGAVETFVRREVQALDPDLPLGAVRTIAQSFAQEFALQRVFSSLFWTFAVIALLLATSGLYGVTSYAVARRTREIGVRVALGADARRVWWAITGTTLRQLGIGVVLGTAGAAAMSTVLPAMIVGAEGANPAIFALVALALVVVGVAASAIPARRATRVDPVTALQCD